MAHWSIGTNRLAGASAALLLVLAATGLIAEPAPPAPVVIGAPLPIGRAQIDGTLEIGGEDIAGKKTRSRMTVGVMVEGRGPFRFVVDSGADSSAIGARTAQALGLALGTPTILNGMTAIARVDRVRVGALTLGKSTIYDLQLPVLRDEDLGAQGLLGIDALVRQRLMMDFEKRIITVEDAQRPARYVAGEVVVVARRRRGQLILTEASVAGRRLDAVIDTGSEITIGNSALRDRLVKHSATKLPVLEIVGVTGVATRIQLATIAELRIGPIMLRDVPIAFADVPPFKAFGLDDAPALLLGTDMMESFRRVSLDFQARRVRFQLRRCQSTGIVISTSEFASLATRSRISGAAQPGQNCRG